jgi:hypothetical protein
MDTSDIIKKRKTVYNEEVSDDGEAMSSSSAVAQSAVTNTTNINTTGPNDEIRLINSRNSNSSQQNDSNNGDNDDQKQTQILLTLINNQLAMMRTKFQEEDMKTVNQKDWYIIASCLDRFCLIIYICLSVFAFLTIF